VTFLAALISPAPSAHPACSSCRCKKESLDHRRNLLGLSIRFILFGHDGTVRAALLNRYGLRNVTLAAQ